MSLCGCDSQTPMIPGQRDGCRNLAGSDQNSQDARQRIIQGTVRVSASEYLMNKMNITAYGTDASKLDTGAQPIKKNDSYARYLAKKKGGGVLREQPASTPAVVPTTGGKVRRFGIFRSSKCSC